MHRNYRRLFNAAFSDELYRDYQTRLCSTLSCSFEFRLAETPVFPTQQLRSRLEDAAKEILAQLSEPARVENMKAAIPERWRVPGMDRLPSFAQIDFAIVRDANGELAPRLIELQGFPSLTAMQVVQRDAWNAVLQKIPGLDREWSCWFSGLDRQKFLDLARRTIVGDHGPEEVALLDIDPPSQKTRPDFQATKLLFDVDAVDPRELTRRGRRLYRHVNGREVQVKRIYNRIVFDELEQKKIPIPFSYHEQLDVEWTPHPNWYWVWSKYSIPFLDHPAVPRATFLSELDQIPDDLSGYVLKPLFSFAGGGVNVDPTGAAIDAIPIEQRPFWCLQEKISYEPAIESVDGSGVKVEIRMMFLRPDDAPKPVLAQNLARLSRGKMLGVDFNKGMSWVGSSVCLFPSDER